MKVSVQESAPGEFSKCRPKDLVEKALAGVYAALTEQTGLSREDLIKAIPPGGELVVVDALSRRMAEVYQAQSKRLHKALLAKFEEVVG